MSTRTIKQEQQHSKHNKAVLASLEEFSRNATRSGELLRDHNILDSLGSAVSKFTREPVKAITETYLEFNNVLFEIIKDFTTKNLFEIKSTVDLYAQTENFSVIHYYIVVKEDSLEIRNPYYDYLDAFCDSDFSKKFEIQLHFIKPGAVKKLDGTRTEHLKKRKASY